MERFLLHKGNFSRAIPSEDEFFYPLVFNTSLLNSRFIGKRTKVELKSEPSGTLEGIFIGSSNIPLSEHFKKHSRLSLEKSSSLLEHGSEKEWLSENLKTLQFSKGIRFVSSPKEPPYYVVLTELKDALLFSSYSESEQEDLPEINYNRIITNESIDKLVSFLKGALPKRKAGEKKKRSEKKESKKAQMRLQKFFR